MRTFWPVTVAALADIHGNVQALDAVLADPRLPEQIVVLGDVVAGTFPAESYDRLAQLGTRVRILRGNADRIVLERSEPSGRTTGSDRIVSRLSVAGRSPSPSPRPVSAKFAAATRPLATTRRSSRS